MNKDLVSIITWGIIVFALWGLSLELILHHRMLGIEQAIRSIEVNNTSHIRTPSVTILDGDWNVREEKGE